MTEDYDDMLTLSPRWLAGYSNSAFDLDIKAAGYAPVRHGRWLLEAHDERANFRWNVTAECSECCDECNEIWAGIFPGVPASLAKETALITAEAVKLPNYCPNCGAKMDGGDGV